MCPCHGILQTAPHSHHEASQADKCLVMISDGTQTLLLPLHSFWHLARLKLRTSRKRHIDLLWAFNMQAQHAQHSMPAD